MKPDDATPYPFANHKSTIYVARQIEALKSVKSQRDIAYEVGYEKPNMISMIKRGEVRVPFDKVFLLAEALEVNPTHLLRLVLEDQTPSRLETIKKIHGEILSDNELEWLTALRTLSDQSDPKFTPARKRALKALLEEPGE